MTNDAAKDQLGTMLHRPPPLAKNAATTRRTASRNSGAPESVVFIVDDDAAMREALQNLLHSVGLEAEVFGSAAELLASKLPDVASCLVLDIRMPGMSGLEFQTQLARANIHTPIIFMTGHGDIPMTVRAMKAGAVDFLTKPFRDQDMLDAASVAEARSWLPSCAPSSGP
jgi:FixJ family two-component response regulator